MDHDSGSGGPQRFQRCDCTGVTRERVLAAMAAGARTIDDLRDLAGVCLGCASCLPELERLLAGREGRGP